MTSLRSLNLAAGLLMLFVVCCVSAQASGAIAGANIDVSIVAPLFVASTQDAQFGQIVPHQGGQITVAPNNSYISNGSVEVVPSSTRCAAIFAVSGANASSFAIVLPQSAVLTNSSGATLTVNQFVSTPSGIGVLTNGTQIVQVGATLTVAAQQVGGSYHGTFPVTVAYN